MNKSTPIPLTSGQQGHTLHHSHVVSPNDEWVVFDNRNNDSQLSSANTISMVHTETMEIRTLYQTFSDAFYGPGVGAVSFSPLNNEVIFIHGIRNASLENPYSATRRTAVSIDVDKPQEPIFMDARNITPPFTVGALRGGTHSHAWNKEATLISFTYNDYVIEQASASNNTIKDQRVVGCMFKKAVEVAADDSMENNAGKMFSVIISNVVHTARNGSDEIEKAFDECWVNTKRQIAFQGQVRDENGRLKTEIFIAQLPNDLTKEGEKSLTGSTTILPGIPKGVIQERITFTQKGVSDFRHWLRSSPTGDWIYCLMEDKNNITQVFRVHTLNKNMEQLTHESKSIHSPINLSEDGLKLTYFRNNCLVVFAIQHDQEIVIYNALTTANRLAGIPNWSKDGVWIYFNQYVTYHTTPYLQIFKIRVPKFGSN